MKWINHILIAAPVAALYDPAAVPFAVLGATAPDWMEWASKALGSPVRHRTVTHYVAVWGVAVVAGLLIHPWAAAFAIGGLSHVLADAMTITGVPLGPWSDRRFHLFGGRLRTGDPGEYFVAWGFVAVCAAIGMMFSRSGWYPFFFDWPGLYQAGIIDGLEWKQNRFRVF